MKCPHCGKQINVGKLLRSKKPSAAQIEAAKLNGAKGGRPKKCVAKPLNDPKLSHGAKADGSQNEKGSK